MKLRYDSLYKPLDIEVGDLVFIKLYKGYKLPGLENAKLSN